MPRVKTATSSDCLLPYYTAHSYGSMGTFNANMGSLQKQLYRGGEYDVFKYAPMFESDFIQISKKGEVIDVHNRVCMVTVCIASTSPILPLPDVMLLARPAKAGDEHARRGRVFKGRGHKAARTLELTRLFPLKFVKISIHDREKQQLRLKLVTGRTFYLQLCPALDARVDLFRYWEKLVYLLRSPAESYSSTPILHPGSATTPKDKKSPLASKVLGEGDSGSQKLPDVSAVTSSAYAGGERLQRASPAAAATSSPGAGTGGSAAVSEATVGSAKAVSIPGSGTSCDSAALCMARTKSPDQITAALSGATLKDSGESGLSKAMAAAANISTEGINVFLAGTASASSVGTSTTICPENSVSVVLAGALTTDRSVAGKAEALVVAPLASTLQSEGYMCERDGSQRVATASPEAQKERRERRDKDRNLGRRRSSHRQRTGERHRSSGKDKSRKSSSRSVAGHGKKREDRKDKRRSSVRVRRHGSSHRSESRTAHKQRESWSTPSTGSVSKKSSKIRSFLRSFLVRPISKTRISSQHRGLDIVAETVEKHNIETKVEDGQDLEFCETVTSETMERIVFEAKSM